MTRYISEFAVVSPSGYYQWLGAEEDRQIREDIDERDFMLIKKHFDALKGRAGALVIKMRLVRENGVVMNHKKICRLMRKYGCLQKIRRSDPYRKMAKATQEHKTIPNLLHRQFDQGESEKVLLTDITNMHYCNGQLANLYCVKDVATKQVLAHYLHSSLDLSLVEKTFDRLLDLLGGNVHSEAVLHFDQGNALNSSSLW